MTEIADIVFSGAKEYGLQLPASAGVAFSDYAAFLQDRARVVNLTAIEGAENTARLHFLDSLALLTVCDIAGDVIDIGSGAGFPGLPLKIARPEISLTLLDAQRKRIDFLTALCELLRLSGVRCIHGRAEETAREAGMRECFDCAVSRAVARLNVLCELCLPFVRVGGVFVAMKSVDSAPEINEALTACGQLGAVHESTIDYAIPGTPVVRRAVVMRKVEPTTEKYPRRYARIEKSPL